MNIDASAFVRRAKYFFAELKRNSYPNATTLQRFDSCSKSTASRTIDRLQSEFNLPIAFDPSERGFFLTNPDFRFEFLPPGKDEYCALFLLRKLADVVGSDDLSRAIDSLWNSSQSTGKALQHDLATIERLFSADLTAVSTLADTGVLQLLQLATVGQHVTLRYKSPWRQSEAREHRGLVERVHLSDGSVYVLFRSQAGRRMVLNAAFIRDIQSLAEPIVMEPPTENDIDLAWLDGFGVWSGEDLHHVSVKIAAPASAYYAAQRWHADQTDRWEGDVLHRTFPSMLSPELVRRILSLGRYVTSLEPPELAARVSQEAELLVQGLSPQRT